jgi:hypothetical protein
MHPVFIAGKVISLSSKAVPAFESDGISQVQGVTIDECIWLCRLNKVGVDAQELVGRRVVVAVDCAPVPKGC